MKLIVSSSSLFKVIFQNIKTFSDYIVIRFRPDGVYAQGQDCSMCCCFELNLAASWFGKYEGDEHEFSIGVATGILQKILAVHHDTQEISMSVTENSDVLCFSFTNGEGVLDTFFEIPLMEIEQDLIQFEPYESEVDLVIGSEKLCELVSQLKMFNDRMRINFSDESVVLEANGVEGSMRTDITTNDVIEYAIGEGVVFNQEYSLDYLGMMAVFKKLNPEFALQFHRERPLEAKYDIGDSGTFMKFFLAPKISTEYDN